MKSLVHGLHFNNIRGDIFGGITAGVVALPLALAFGVSSGAGAIAGIYGAIFVGFFAALFGGTPAQVSGPTGPMTVVMALIFTKFTGMYPDNPATGAALAFTVVMLGGLFQILFGVFKIGKYINLVPHPVTSGFMSGIGIIIILLQLGPLLGHAVPAGGPLAAAKALPEFLKHPAMHALSLGLLALAIVYFLPKKINKYLPSPLLALVVGTLALYFYTGGDITTQQSGGKTIYLMGQASILGDIPTGLPNLQLPVFKLSLLAEMVKSGIVLALLGTIDSLLTSLVADNITRSHHRSNRELIGQGIGNMVAGVFGGLPGAGATMRTVVNVRAGGQTPISGALHALLLLAVVLGLAGLAKYIPHAVLAGILIKVGTDIIDWGYLRDLRKAPLAGVVIMLVVLFVTVFVDLITAVSLGMVMASLLFLKRMTDLQIDSITAITEPGKEIPLTPKEAAILQQADGRILLYHIGGPLSFGAAKGMVRRLAAFKAYDALVIDMSSVPMVDYTSSRAIYDMVVDAQAAQRSVYLVGVKPKVKRSLKKQGILELVGKDHLMARRYDALRHAADDIGITKD